MCVLDANGAAAVESLRAELARAKEQASESDAATRKALEELRAEQDAHCRSKEEMAEMAEKLKSVADHCKFLEKEDRARQTDLEKTIADAKDARSTMRVASGRTDCGWKALYAAEEVLRSEVCSVGPDVECGGHLSGFGSECC